MPVSSMDTAVLEWIHGLFNPALDDAFRLSHEFGTFLACTILVLAMALWHSVRGERRVAVAWIVLGVAVALLPEIGKTLTARVRPALWSPLVDSGGYSFPSGHATAGAAIYPFLAWTVSRGRPAATVRRFLIAGVAMGAFVGVGRLYLGVHWPSDVLAGWALGGVLAAAAIRWLSRSARDASARAKPA